MCGENVTITEPTAAVGAPQLGFSLFFFGITRSESSDVKVTFFSPTWLDGVIHAVRPLLRLKTTCVNIELFGCTNSAKAAADVRAKRTRSICGLVLRCPREGTLLWPIRIVPGHTWQTFWASAFVEFSVGYRLFSALDKYHPIGAYTSKTSFSLFSFLLMLFL